MALTHATLFSLCLIGQAPAPADRDEDRLFQRLMDRAAVRVDATDKDILAAGTPGGPVMPKTR